MCRSKVVYSIVLFFCLIPLLLEGQDEADNDLVGYEAVLISGHLGGSFPAGNLRGKLSDSGFGGGGQILILVDKRNPLYLGLDVSHFNYDQEFFYTDILIDGFLSPVEYRTRANILTGHAVFRYSPVINFFLQPYIDGMFGFKHFVTRTRITYLDAEDDDYDQFVEDGDWALSYGGALGLQVPLYYAANGFGVKLDLRFEYLRGTAADYNVRNESWLPGSSEPINAFDLENSTTDLMIPKVGVLISFGRKVFEEVPEEDW